MLISFLPLEIEKFTNIEFLVDFIGRKLGEIIKSRDYKFLIRPLMKVMNECSKNYQLATSSCMTKIEEILNQFIELCGSEYLQEVVYDKVYSFDAIGTFLEKWEVQPPSNQPQLNQNFENFEPSHQKMYMRGNGN